MAYTLKIETEESLELEDYVEYVRRHVDLSDEDAVLESAGKLKALANNPRFMSRRLNQQLAQWRDFQAGNDYTAQTFMLGSGPGFFVRANIWIPPHELSHVRKWNEPLFAYRLPHDHNFSFMTVGYYGSGYETTIFEYDPTAVNGAPGERVALKFLERTKLGKGKVMFYRASRDIHSQEHPEEFSISLNLMIAPPDLTLKEQFRFDLEEHRIVNPIDNTAMARLMLCEVAKHVGDSTTARRLEELASRHPSPRVRAAGFDSLAVLEKGQRERIFKMALEDESELVRGQARKWLSAEA